MAQLDSVAVDMNEALQSLPGQLVFPCMVCNIYISLGSFSFIKFI